MSDISLDIEIEERDFFQSMKFHVKKIYQIYVEFWKKNFKILSEMFLLQSRNEIKTGRNVQNMPKITQIFVPVLKKF